jgi:hypothetical protein
VARIARDALAEIGDGAVEIAFPLRSSRRVVPGERKGRIELDRAVEVGNRAVIVALELERTSAAVIRRRVVRVELHGFRESLDGAFGRTLLAIGKTGVIEGEAVRCSILTTCSAITIAAMRIHVDRALADFEQAMIAWS